MGPFGGRGNQVEALSQESPAACEDARALRAGSYSAWLRKAKSDSAKAKWLCGSTRRYFTIDFDSQIFFYAHAEGSKKISHPVRFQEITGAERLPAPAKATKRGGKSTQSCGFLVRTRERNFELHTASHSDAAQWVFALNAARDIGSAADAAERQMKEGAQQPCTATQMRPNQPAAEEPGKLQQPAAPSPAPPTEAANAAAAPQPPAPPAEPLSAPPAAPVAPAAPAPLQAPAPTPAAKELAPAAAPTPEPAAPAPAPADPAETEAVSSAATSAAPAAASEGAPAPAAVPAVAPAGLAPPASPAVRPAGLAPPAGARVFPANIVSSASAEPTAQTPVVRPAGMAPPSQLYAVSPAGLLPPAGAPVVPSAAVQRMAAAVASSSVPVISASAAAGAGKQYQPKQQVEDGPGPYRIVSAGPLQALPVSKDCARTSAKVGEVAVLQDVEVLEVAAELDGGRRRARIADPAGWVTILDTNSGFRFAMKQVAEQETKAEPEKTKEAESPTTKPSSPPAGAGVNDACKGTVRNLLMDSLADGTLEGAAAAIEASADEGRQKEAQDAVQAAAQEGTAAATEAPVCPAIRVTRAGVKRLPKIAGQSPQVSEDSHLRPAPALAGKRASESPSPGLKKVVSFDENEEVRPIAARGEESPCGSSQPEQPASPPPLPPAPVDGASPVPPPREDGAQPEAALRITRPNANVKRLPKLAGHMPRSSPRQDAAAAPALAASEAAEPSGWDDDEEEKPKIPDGPASQSPAEPSGWDSDEEKKATSPAKLSKPQEKVAIPEGPVVAMEIAAPSGFDSDEEPQAKPVVTLARPASASKGGVAMEFDMGGPKKAVPEGLAERLSRKRPPKRSSNKSGQRMDPTRQVDARKAAIGRRPSQLESLSAAPTPPPPVEAAREPPAAPSPETPEGCSEPTA